MTARRLLLWRHGRTEWNVDNRFQGQADVPLDEVGRQQAKAAAIALAEYEPDRIVSSDLSRALQTAQTVADLIGLPVATDRRLREIHVGRWEGLLGREVEEVDPELARGLRAGEEVRRSSTGESPAEVAARMVEVMTEIAEAAPDGSTVLFATHGLAARVGAAALVGLPEASWRLLGGMSNCGWISIDRHRSGAYWRIEAYNATVPDAARDFVGLPASR